MRVSASLGLDAEGKFTAFRLRWDVNLGAYVSGRSGWGVGNIGGIAGVYIIQFVAAQVCGVLTHTVPTAAYRGAGRPEATYAIERMIDVAAREVGISPYELRRRNLIPPEAMPYKTALTFTYDCGEFEGNMREAAALAELASFEERRTEAAGRGMLRGIGLCNCIEVAGGPFPASRQGHRQPTSGRGRYPGAAFRFDVGGAGVGDGVQPTRGREVRRGADSGALSGRRYRPVARRQGQRRFGARFASADRRSPWQWTR